MENTTMNWTANVTSDVVAPEDDYTIFYAFWKNYQHVHGYVSGAVCVFGVVTNILNVVVLTRRHMITPINCHLTALAAADFLTMLTYLVYAIYFYIVTDPTVSANHSKGWMYFILIHNHFIIVCHNTAVWITVSLAVLRYIFVCHNVIGSRIYSINKAVVTITIICICSIVISIPSLLLYKVVKMAKFYPGLSGYWIIDSDFVDENKGYKLFIFWLFGVVAKIVPSILLIVLSSRIILTMHRARKRRAQLMQQTRDSEQEATHRHNRTTWMLISVVICFLITELPQGILTLISGLDDMFFETVYSNLGDAMDLLALLNSAVNFVIYCSMSQQFRDTFKDLFVKSWRCPCHDASSSSLDETLNTSTSNSVSLQSISLTCHQNVESAIKT